MSPKMILYKDILPCWTENTADCSYYFEKCH